MIVLMIGHMLVRRLSRQCRVPVRLAWHVLLVIQCQFGGPGFMYACPSSVLRLWSSVASFWLSRTPRVLA